ncbi:MAG TPA: AAA family ATPase, partial [Nitrolancea sp.]|nr:AAA family ATPase [Nitrolancea sp.]
MLQRQRQRAQLALRSHAAYHARIRIAPKGSNVAGASREPYLFVSYASADRERVLPVVDRLQHAGVNAWIDREGIHGGANYAQVISDAIKGAAALMLMASPASLASRNVRQELALGWRFERPYLPLLLDRITIPDELAYWLEGSQWIELLDHPEDVWLAGMAQALGHLGIEIRLGAGPVERATPPRERPPLVGREHEQALLSQQLARMLGGRGGVVLIGGEAGIGKSTLVEDLSAQAEESGALVLWGHAYDLSVTPPYGPWVEILRQYPASAPGMPLPPTFVGDAEALAKIGSQETLFAATRDFFQAVAAQRPLVLVLNDLHWADQSTLDFFRFLARQLANQRILLVATYRTDEVNRRHPLHILLPLLVREAGAERLVVRPLDAAGHRALIQSRYALAEADQVRLEDYLEARAEGNPLYAGELLRTLEEERILTRQDDDWVLGDLEQVRVPALLRQVIEGRAARLDEESQRLLGIAAVIGQTAPLVIWAAAGEVDEDSLLELAERAEEAGLLEALPDGDGVRFSHALIRSTLYEVLPPLRRRRLHRQVADVLLALPGPDPDSVAFHLEQGGDARAIDWLIRAGERALRLYAFDAAIAHFSQAESLAARQTAAVPGTLYASRGQAYRLTGQFDAARHDFETVLTLARQSGDPRVEWQADIDLGMLWAARNYARTGEYFQQALALARTMDAPDLTAHALNRVGNWHVNSQQPLNALRHHEEALKIFEQLGDRAGIAITSDLLGLASYLAGDLIQGTMHYRRAVELFREADNREGLSSALAVMSMRGGTFMTDTMVVEQVTLDECVRDAEEAV